ncbi:AAA family ATPase [Lentisphaera profundi]|uniref:AAA family ATPase n=1 Tax=Lentisphaera profundi TaxID=1658616 RepID=A0ABY7VQC0_9BACT|nr:AAA family ATPase [Lentisphaera profundi]WDE96378.1 AAA family ATPase [Lentisphaera profundi]
MSDFLKSEEAKVVAEAASKLKKCLNQVLFGQEELVDLVCTGLFARGHMLLEGLPGLGKTELVKGLSKALGLDFKRIQFTPDLLPGDISGNPLIQEKDGKKEFVFQKGPIFGNLILADEINRASPKTQSAMLEAMQEKSVTVAGQSHALPDPFFVLATQNPIELEGTYALPEAQLDRFLFKLDVHHASVDVLEKIVLSRELGDSPEVEQVLSHDELQKMIGLVKKVHIPQQVAQMIAQLVNSTQAGQSEMSEHIKFGAGPRAAIALAAACKARALIEGRVHTGFEDVRDLALPVLRHRLILDYRARIEGHTPDSIVKSLLSELKIIDKAVPVTMKEES